jgi:hypothetical protein
VKAENVVSQVFSKQNTNTEKDQNLEEIDTEL